MSLQKYFDEIESGVHESYDLANKARSKNLDPRPVVEIDIATSLAQRALGLVSLKYPQMKDSGIDKRIKELEEKYGFLDAAVAVQIAEEVAKEKFCKFTSLLQAIEAGSRLGFAYLTMGVVVCPLEGLTHIELKKTLDGKDYIAAYYSGPIRAAGTTMGSFSLVIIDYLRELFGFAKYDPTEQEVRRGITEIYDYHERITNLQYLASEEEADFLLRRVPIQIDGFPSEDREVSNYKDLPRIATNRLRNGFCLELSECLAQKARKIVPLIKKLKEKGFKISGWDFLIEYLELQEKLTKKKTKAATGTYIQDAVAGRPIFGHPSYSGAFRLRYGRCRTNGYSAVSISPATMKILQDFIAAATQIKLEKPMKAAAVGVCDSIDGPIVRLKDKSVVVIKSKEEAEKYVDDVDEILYTGDILISYGDFFDRNQLLLPPGYCSEWWLVEVKEALKNSPNQEIESILSKKITLENAIKISKSLKVPLHPDFIFFWSQISNQQFSSLLNWIADGKIVENKFLLPYESINRENYKEAKRALEIIGAEHKVATADVVLEEIIWKSIFINLGLVYEKSFKIKLKEYLKNIENLDKKVLDIMNSFSEFKIKDKAGSFIGTRMGRPEKSKPRELTGAPSGLFPVGDEGGRMRSFQAALLAGTVKADFPIFYCDNCKKESIYQICSSCNQLSRRVFYCSKCVKKLETSSCNIHGKAQLFMQQRINIKEYYEEALKKANKQFLIESDFSF